MPSIPQAHAISVCVGVTIETLARPLLHGPVLRLCKKRIFFV